MNKQIIYRGYIPGDEKGITDLLVMEFPNWRGINSLDVWRWKYLKTPFGSSVYVALDGDLIVGVIEDMNLRIKVKGCARASLEITLHIVLRNSVDSSYIILVAIKDSARVRFYLKKAKLYSSRVSLLN